MQYIESLWYIWSEHIFITVREILTQFDREETDININSKFLAVIYKKTEKGLREFDLMKDYNAAIYANCIYKVIIFQYSLYTLKKVLFGSILKKISFPLIAVSPDRDH